MKGPSARNSAVERLLSTRLCRICKHGTNSKQTTTFCKRPTAVFGINRERPTLGVPGCCR